MNKKIIALIILVVSVMFAQRDTIYNPGSMKTNGSYVFTVGCKYDFADSTHKAHEVWTQWLKADSARIAYWRAPILYVDSIFGGTATTPGAVNICHSTYVTMPNTHIQYRDSLFWEESAANHTVRNDWITVGVNDSMFFSDTTGVYSLYTLALASGLNRYMIMDSLAKYAESGYRGTFYQSGAFAGDSNYVGGVRNVILGGRGDTITDGAIWMDSTRNCGILAGEGNYINGSRWSAITGGVGNWIYGGYNVIDGGVGNFIPQLSTHSIIDGGGLNLIDNGYASGIFTGISNYLDTVSTSAIIAGSYNVMGTSRNSLKSVIVGGTYDTINGNYNVILGGQGNAIYGDWAVIAGGYYNNVASRTMDAFISGEYNYIDGDECAITGGSYDTISQNAWVGLIGGGEYCTIEGGDWNAMTGGYRNRIADNASKNGIVAGDSNYTAPYNEATFIGGGHGDTIIASSYCAIVGGWSNNLDTASWSFIGGGMNNYAYYFGNAIVGGNSDSVLYDAVLQESPTANFIGSGYSNRIKGNANAICGGEGNVMDYGNYNAMEGGYHNYMEYGTKNVNRYNEISGGSYDTILDGEGSAIVGGTVNGLDTCELSGIFVGSLNHISQGACDAIVGGSADTINATPPQSYSFIGAGYSNKIQNTASAIIGGGDNHIILVEGDGGQYSGIVAGQENCISSDWSSISGGYADTVRNDNSGIVAGNHNITALMYSFIGGGQNNYDSSASSGIMAGDNNWIVDGTQNAICGGLADSIRDGSYSGIFAGYSSYLDTTVGSVILGGLHNLNDDGDYSGILGGSVNVIGRADNSGIVAGAMDSVLGDYSVVAGGVSNKTGTGGDYSFIGGGANNYVNGTCSGVFGEACTTSASDGFLFGNHNRIYGANSNQCLSGGINSAIRISVGSAVLGNAARVDTCNYAFAFNCRVRHDSVFGVSPHLHVYDSTAFPYNDTTKIDGRGIELAKYIFAKTDTLCGKVVFAAQTRIARYIPGLDTSDVVLVTPEDRDEDGIVYADAYCKADSIIVRTSASYTGAVQYLIIRRP